MGDCVPYVVQTFQDRIPFRTANRVAIINVRPERHAEIGEVVSYVAWSGVAYIELPTSYQRAQQVRNTSAILLTKAVGNDYRGIIVKVPTESLKLGGQADEQCEVQMLGRGWRPRLLPVTCSWIASRLSRTAHRSPCQDVSAPDCTFATIAAAQTRTQTFV